MTTLMKDGKEVVALAVGSAEFYPMNENADGSISFNGQTYAIGNKVSSLFMCRFYTNSGTVPCNVGFELNQKLGSDSALTVKDLIDKRKKIRLILSFLHKPTSSYFTLASGIVDLSKPDSNGHFNFQWVNGATSTNTYCCSDSDLFRTYSDALGAYSSSYYDAGNMTILYSDGS